MGRQKDIHYASRAESHIKRQKQLHELRRVIAELSRHVGADDIDDARMRELGLNGCDTTMHVLRLLAPALDSEDYFKDIDFTSGGIEARWQAGLADARFIIESAPWAEPFDPMEGIIVHELSARTGGELRKRGFKAK
jgi:NTE family protein